MFSVFGYIYVEGLWWLVQRRKQHKQEEEQAELINTQKNSRAKTKRNSKKGQYQKNEKWISKMLINWVANY
jgi:hypothetical protein